MSNRPVLVLDSYGTSIGGTQSAYTMIESTIDPQLRIGSAFSHSDEPSGSRNQSLFSNTIVRWGNYIYAQVNATSIARIYRYDTTGPTQDWELYHSLTNLPTATNRESKPGLYILMINRVPHLIGMSGTSTGVVAFKINLLTDAKTETTTTAVSFQDSVGVRTPILYKNILYFGAGDGGRPWYYDPRTNTIAQTTGTATAQNRDVLTVYDGRLFWLVYLNPVMLIYELDEATQSWATLYTTTINITDGTTFSHSRWAAWPAPGKINPGQSLWVMSNTRTISNSVPEWQLHEIYFETDVVSVDWSSALPASLINNGPGVAASANGKWRPMIDNETTPGTPIVNLFLSSNSDTPGILSRWVFDSAGPSLTLVDTGLLNTGWIQTPLDSTYGGGDRFWAPGQPTIKLVDHESAALTNQRLTFVIDSSNPTDLVDVEFYFTKNSEIATTRCSLNVPSAGTIQSNTGGDYISGLVADGVTEYQVTWLASDDGVVVSDFVEVIARIITNG